MNLKDAQEKTTVLQSKLYKVAKQAPRRRFHQLYDKLFREDVLWSAWYQVRANRGAPGIDGISIADIEALGAPQYLSDLGRELHQQTYKPQPVRRVEIPKANGKMRKLGIPTVRDRIVQAAAKLVLEPIFEADFKPVSFGFRPGMGQPEALTSVHWAAQNGYRFVVDADIEGFFDNLDHEQMMEALRRRISDGAVSRLIHYWLKAGVYVGFLWNETDQGTPQGGVISPLLANIYLHGLDASFEDPAKWLQKRQTVLRLSGQDGWTPNPYRGRANIRWKAV
jgi:RNA-directed DNA polymerase